MSGLVCPNILLWASYGKQLKSNEGWQLKLMPGLNTLSSLMIFFSLSSLMTFSSLNSLMILPSLSSLMISPSWAAWWSSLRWTASWSSIIRGRKGFQLLLVLGVNNIKIKKLKFFLKFILVGFGCSFLFVFFKWKYLNIFVRSRLMKNSFVINIFTVPA